MLAVIGGTGLYNIDGFELLGSTEVETPFGQPSAAIKKLKFAQREIFFLPRHGESHEFLPHEVNYRANIFALKKLGATQILGFSAIGSLREELCPGDFVVPSQYVDWVKGDRQRTFFGKGLSAHISTAEPTSENLTNWIFASAKQLGFTLHTDKTYICVDGPRLGTRAESHFMRQIGCDVVGMTNVPEVFLAREAQMDYATIGIVTDYDCWKDDPETHVTVDKVIERFGESLGKGKQLLSHMLSSKIPSTTNVARTSLAHAMLTPEAGIEGLNREIINVLRL